MTKRVATVLRTYGPRVAPRLAWLTSITVLTLAASHPAATAKPLGGGQAPTPSAAAIAAAQAAQQNATKTARDAANALKRATLAIQAQQATQAAARKAAADSLALMPSVPKFTGNGLDGLVRSTAPGALWEGASGPRARDGKPNEIVIDQDAQKAILDWRTFNIGEKTTLTFDQAHGRDAVALNRITGGAPSQILGKLEAPGSIYVINQNGIIFGNRSQVNVGTLVASSLSLSNEQFRAGINTQLKFADNQSNADIAIPQFGYLGQQRPNLFIPFTDPNQVPGAVIGEAPKPVVVEAGAQITMASGGKAMLFAPKVINAGRIAAPDGQVIMAAGEQVYLMTDQTGIRGLDVAVSAPMRWLFANYQLDDAVRGIANQTATIILPEMAARAASVGYSVVNDGIVQADRGNITVMGREIVQNGGLFATTALNNRDGSIRLRAWDQGMRAYGGSAGNTTLARWSAGTLTLGENSTTTVTPDLSDTSDIENGALATRYRPGRVEMRGKFINIASEASVIVPAGSISVVASASPLSGEDILPGDPLPRDGSRIYIGEDAYLSVAGLQDILVAMERNFIEAELRINELRDSPLYRDSWLRGMKVIVDRRRAGNFDDGPMTGVEWVLDAAGNAIPGAWVGTPLADVSGWIGNGITNLAELSTKGGSIIIKSSGSVITRKGSLLDVSGGSVRYTDGWNSATRLLGADGRIYDIGSAMPDQAYIALADGYTRHNAHWNITQTWSNPLNKSQGRFEQGYTEGRNAGTIQFYAGEAMVLEGSYWGGTIAGERQAALGNLAKAGTLKIGALTNAAEWLPGEIIVQSDPVLLDPEFTATDALDLAWYDGSNPALAFRSKTTYLDSDVLTQSGMDSFDFYAAKGFTLAQGERLEFAPGTNFSVVGIGSNLYPTTFKIDGTIRIAGGNVKLLGPTTYGAGAKIDVSGQWVNGRSSDAPALAPKINGGTIQASGLFAPGVVLDVSGGGWLQAPAKIKAGNAGSIDITLSNAEQLRDLDLRGYAAGSGGELTINGLTANAQLGGAAPSDPSVLHLPAKLFGDRGFRSLTVMTLGSIVLPEHTTVTQVPVSVILDDKAYSSASGTRITELGHLAVLPLPMRAGHKPTALVLNGNDVTVGSGAALRTDVGGTIALTAQFGGRSPTMGPGDVIVSGTIDAPAGEITIDAPYGKVRLADGGKLLARGVARIETDRRGIRTGEVLDGGSVDIDASYVTFDPGSLIDVSGTSAAIDIEMGGLPRPAPKSLRLDSNGGSITISGPGLVAGALRAHAGRLKGIGGSVSFTAPGSGGEAPGLAFREAIKWFDPACNIGPCDFDWHNVIGFDLDYYLGTGVPMILTEELAAALPTDGAINIILSKTAQGPVEGTLDPASFGLTPEALDSLRDNLGLDLRTLINAASGIKSLVVRPETITAGGFANLSMNTAGNVRLDGVNLTLGSSIAISGGLMNGNGTSSTIRAPHISLTGLSSGTDTPTGKLTLEASLIDIDQASIRGFAATTLQAADIRLSAGLNQVARLETEGLLTLKAGQIYPSSRTVATIKATDKIVVQRNGTVAPPLSAGGQLTLEAPEIEQGGTLRAPFGSITLKASNRLTLARGSVTSVSGKGLIVPFGNLLNDEEWSLVDDGGMQVPIASLPEKRIVLDAPTVDQAAGSLVDIQGGGDLFAWEHVPGPGGSHDVLTRPGTFAIMPALRNATAPLDTATGAGDRVWLAGGNGLAAGWYTLLPARYAMLPGAYAVSLVPGSQNTYLSNALTMADGSFIMEGARGYAFGGQDQLRSTWRVMSGATLRQYSEYNEAFANEFFSSDAFKLTQYRLTGQQIVTPRLPMDGGAVVFKATQELILDGQLQSRAAAGGRGGLMDIAAAKIAVVGVGQDTAALRRDGYLVLDSDALSGFGAGSLLIGGTRSSHAKGMLVDVMADDIIVRNDETSALEGPEVILAASGKIDIGADSVIAAQGEAPLNAGDLVLKPHLPTKDYGALVRVSNGNAVRVVRENVDTTIGGVITIGARARLDGGKSLLIDSTRNTVVAATARISGASLSLSSGRISLGGGSEGLVLDLPALARLSSTQHLTLRSYGSIDFHSSINFGGAGLAAVTLDAASLVGYGVNPVTIAGGTIVLDNSGAVFAEPIGAGSGHLALVADELVLGLGTKSLRGFATISLAGRNRIVGLGTGSVNAGAANLTLNTPLLTGRAAASQSIVTSGALRLSGGTGSAINDAEQSLGTRIALTGGSIAIDGRIVGLGGAIEVTATNGDIVLSNGSLISVGGFAKQFFDVAQYADAGRISLTAVGGDVRLASGASLDLSAATGGGNAGSLSLTSSGGTVTLDGSISARAGAGGKGGSFALDIAELPGFSALSRRLNDAGFSRSRQFRIRDGNVVVDGTTTVEEFALVADHGTVTVAGTIDARSAYGGRITITGGEGLTMQTSAALDAGATNALGSGRVTLEAAGGLLDVRGGTIDVSGGQGGKVRFRARQIADIQDPDHLGHTDIAVAALRAVVNGASVLEGVSTYRSETTGAIKAEAIADAATFISNATTIASRLGIASDKIMAGITIESAGDLTVDSDWNLFADFAARREGTLTLRAGGNLLVNGSISDGFNVAGRTGVLQDAASWDLRLVSGADLSSASATALRPLASLSAGSGSLIVGNSTTGKMIRTGTGDIDVRTARNIDLAHPESVIYTAGRKDTQSWSDFVTAPANATYGISGGHLRIAAQGNVSSALPANRAPMQLYTEWLKRQGALDASYNFGPHMIQGRQINEQSSWWVDYGAFQQGVGALGGGNVEVNAGGDLVNLLVAMPTTGRVRGGRTSAERKLLELRNGGSMTIDAAGAVRAGYYYLGRGAGTIDAGEFTTGRTVNINYQNTLTSYAIAPVLSLGDATMSVRTTGGLRLQTVLDPLMIAMGTDSGSFMSGQTDRTALDLTSVGGDVVLVNQAKYLSRDLTLVGLPNGSGPWFYDGMNNHAGNIYPSQVRIAALNGSVTNLDTFYTLPGSSPELRILADRDVVPGTIVMSRATPEMIPSPYVPIGGGGAPVQIQQWYDLKAILYNNITLPPSNITGHQLYLYGLRNPDHLPNENDYEPSRIYALTGSIVNPYDVNLRDTVAEIFGIRAVTTSEQTWFRAGTDIRGIDYRLRNVHRTDVSSLEAGNDIIGGSITIQGPGSLTLAAGRDVYGPNFSILSTGNRAYDNNNRPMLETEIRGLPTAGTSISVLAGLNGKQADYDAFMAAYLDPANVATMPSYLKTVRDGVLVPIYLVDATEDRQDTTKTVRRGLVSFVAEITGEKLSPSGAWTRFRTLPKLTQEVFLRRAYLQELREAGKDQNTPDANGLPVNGGYNRGYAAIATLFPGNAWKGDVMIGSSKFRTMAGGDIAVLTPGGGLQVASLGASVPDGAGIVALGTGDIGIFARNDVTVNRSRILTFGGGDEIIWSTLGDIDAGRGAKTARVSSAPEIVTDEDAITKILEAADISGSGIGTIIGFTGVPPGDLHLIAPKGTVNAGDAGIRVSGDLNLAALHIVNAANIQVGGKSKGVPVIEVPDIGGLSDASNAAGAAAQQAATPDQNRAAAQPSVIIVEVLGFGGGDDCDPDGEQKCPRKDPRQGAYNPSGAVQYVGAGALTQSERNKLTPEEQKNLSTQ